MAARLVAKGRLAHQTCSQFRGGNADAAALSRMASMEISLTGNQSSIRRREFGVC